MRRILYAPYAGSPPMLSLFTMTGPFPFISLRTWFVTSIHRLPAPQSAFTTCQPPPLCAWAGVEKKQEAASRQNKGRYLMGCFIGSPYPIYREVEQPREGSDTATRIPIPR